MKFFAFAFSTIFAAPITTNGLIQYAHMDNNPFGSFGFIGQNRAVVPEGNAVGGRGIIFTNGRLAGRGYGR